MSIFLLLSNLFVLALLSVLYYKYSRSGLKEITKFSRTLTTDDDLITKAGVTGINPPKTDPTEKGNPDEELDRKTLGELACTSDFIGVLEILISRGVPAWKINHALQSKKLVNLLIQHRVHSVVQDHKLETLLKKTQSPH